MRSPRSLRSTPALDGIRGLAIVLVMMVHIRAWQGGFVGVDLFFVLSGFLITTLLLQEREHTGGVSFSGFYRRRAHRLLPPLALAVLLGLVTVEVYPHQLGRWPYWAGMLSALFYVTNWVQLVDHQALRTLAHTWSLAVEEQFYLFWPASLLLVLRHKRRESRPVLRVVAVVAVVSVASLVVGERLAPGVNWYVAPFGRAGELLLGGGLSVLWRHRRVPRLLSSPGAGVAALAGLAAVFATADEGTRWLYSWGGLYIAAGAGVVLVATVMERPRSILTRVLAWRPFTATGRISYGMYLYNYPLTFLLSPAVLGVGTVPCQLLELAATWALGAASYRFVERPMIARGRRASASRAPAPAEPQARSAPQAA